MRTYWLAIDENGDESVHQYEPIYNKLHKKWRSTTGVYITKGLSKLLISPEFLNERTSIIVAIAYEVEEMGVINNKVRVVNSFKIY